MIGESSQLAPRIRAYGAAPTLQTRIASIIARLPPCGIAEILAQSFRLYRKHFFTFLAIAAVLYVPIQVLYHAANLVLLRRFSGFMYMMSTAAGQVERGEMTPEAANALLVVAGFLSVGIIVLLVMFWILQYLSQAPLTAAVADSYLDRPVSFGGAYRAAFRRLGPLLGSIMAQALIFVALFTPTIALFVYASLAPESRAGVAASCLAFILIIVAGKIATYIFVRLAVVAPAVIAEDIRVVQSLRRSWALVRGYWWRTLGLLTVLTLASFVVPGIPTFLVMKTITALVGAADRDTLNVIEAGVSTVMTTLYIPVQLVATTLYYFDLRVRKERLAEQAAPGRAPAPTPPGEQERLAMRDA